MRRARSLRPLKDGPAFRTSMKSKVKLRLQWLCRPVVIITWAAAIRRNSIGQAQTAQGDCLAGDQWARNTFDPSLRLAHR
jgi:hypothetical protein